MLQQARSFTFESHIVRILSWEALAGKLIPEYRAELTVSYGLV